VVSACEGAYGRLRGFPKPIVSTSNERCMSSSKRIPWRNAVRRFMPPRPVSTRTAIELLKPLDNDGATSRGALGGTRRGCWPADCDAEPPFFANSELMLPCANRPLTELRRYPDANRGDP
jgi:hypothetical protein